MFNSEACWDGLSVDCLKCFDLLNWHDVGLYLKHSEQSNDTFCQAVAYFVFSCEGLGGWGLTLSP